MKASFTAVSRIVVSGQENSSGTTQAVHESTDFWLTISPNLDIEKYLDGRGLPNEEGSKACTNAFVFGLIGNIHLAHQRGWRDSAEHLRYIISQLEEGFIKLVDIKEKER